ncbi:MAG TPA: response regulator transcription factor [Bacteroidia bacterium]|nr:response regulator transcription factor [Bacteroidia bacterium]
MENLKKIKILIVDDHTILRDGLERALGTNPTVGLVKQAASGIEAIEIIKDFEPEIIFMDIFMDEMDGLETSVRILEMKPQIKIIAFSQFDDKDHITGMFSAGVKGYVVKTSGISVINEAIKTVMEGRNYFSKELSNTVFGDIKSKRSSFKNYHLTLREKEILNYIANGLKVKQIAQNLHISERTIEWHKNNLMEKLEVENTAALINKANKEKLID